MDIKDIEELPYEVDFMSIAIDKSDNLRVVYGDTHFSDFTGLHPSKIKDGKLSLYDIIRPADRERITQALFKKNARFVYLDFDLIDKNSNPVFLHCIGENYESNNLCRLTFADVSNSVKKSRALQERAMNMSELIDLVDGGVCLFKVSPEMHCIPLFFNEGCCRVFGTTIANSRLKDNFLEDLVHPDDRSAVFQAIGKSMATNETFKTECRVRIKKGEYIWCQVNAGIQKYDGECPVFHAALTDITRIKEAENKADEEREKMKLLFENLPGPIFFTKDENPFELRLASEDFLEFIGYSRTEIFHIFKGNLKKIIECENIEAVAENIKKSAKSSPMVCAEYKLKIGGGKVISVYDNRKVIAQKDGSFAFVGVLTAK